MATAACLGLDVQQDLLTGYIGEGIAAEFGAFRRALDLPDPAAVLLGKVQWKHDPYRLDRTFAVLTSCALMCADKTTPERTAKITRMWDIIAAVADSAADLCINPVATLAKSGCLTTPNAAKSLMKLQPMMREAGAL
jgi:hypothetical protein